MTETERFVIASQRQWNADLAKRLSARCKREFIAIDDPATLTRESLARSKPSYVFFPHWSARIPADVWQSFECVIFHMTDVPYGRGGSPLQNLIVRGHKDTMITALRCTAGLDEGPVYLKKPLSLQGSASEIFDRADKVIEEMIVEILENRPVPVPQDGEPTVFKRRTPRDSDLLPATTLEQVYDLIRMLDAPGYPPAFLETERFRLEFHSARQNGESVEAAVTITARRAERGR